MSERTGTDSRPTSVGRSQGSAECLTPPPQGLAMAQQQMQQMQTQQQQPFQPQYYDTQHPPTYQQPPQYQQGYDGRGQQGGGQRRGQQQQQQQQPQQDETNEPRTLLVVLRELSDSIELDQIFAIFTQFGVVEKLSSFLQHGKNQVVVQFANAASAQRSLGYLNGRELRLSGVQGDVTCTLAILPSRLKELTFKRDDNRNRDFTQTNANLHRLIQMVRARDSHEDIAAVSQSMQLPPLYDFVWNEWVFGEGWLHPQQPEESRGVIPDVQQLPEGRHGDCVHVSGLPNTQQAPTKITAAMLWNVCGMYGTLVAVKILAQHPGCALVQFTSRRDADNCIKNINYAKLWNNKIFAQTSRNANATHWRGAHTELEARMCTAQDKMLPAPAPLHLTGPPSATIAAWGLPGDDASAMQVMADLCVGQGPNAGSCLSVCARGQGMATAQFATPEAAFDAVAALNNTQGTHNGFAYTMCLHYPSEELLAYPVTVSTQIATPPGSSFGCSSVASTPPHLTLGGHQSSGHLNGTPQNAAIPMRKHSMGGGGGGGIQGQRRFLPPTASPATTPSQVSLPGDVSGRQQQHTPYAQVPEQNSWGASRTA